MEWRNSGTCIPWSSVTVITCDLCESVLSCSSWKYTGSLDHFRDISSKFSHICCRISGNVWIACRIKLCVTNIVWTDSTRLSWRLGGIWTFLWLNATVPGERCRESSVSLCVCVCVCNELESGMWQHSSSCSGDFRVLWLPYIPLTSSTGFTLMGLYLCSCVCVCVFVSCVFPSVFMSLFKRIIGLNGSVGWREKSFDFDWRLQSLLSDKSLLYDKSIFLIIHRFWHWKLLFNSNLSVLLGHWAIVTLCL